MTERDSTAPRPMVGVSLMVIREFDGEPHILLGQRKGSHGAGEWSTPGGHLENGETPGLCAVAELLEECGDEIEVTTPRPLCVSNVLDYMPKHYIDIGMLSYWISGDPKLMEPDKCLGWTWHPVSRLPLPLFATIQDLVHAFRSGRNWFL